MAGIDKLRSAAEHRSEASRQASGNTSGSNRGSGVDRLRSAIGGRADVAQEQRNIERSNEQRVRNIESAVGRVFEGRAQTVADWKRTAEYAAALAESDMDGARDTLDFLMWNYEDQLRPHTDVLVGEDFWDKNLSEQPGPSMKERLLGGAGAVANKLDSAFQPVAHTIGALRVAASDDDMRQGMSRTEALKEAGRYAARSIDVTRVLPNYGGFTEEALFPGDTEGQGRIWNDRMTGGLNLDTDGDGRLSLKEALNRTTEPGDDAVPYAQDFAVEVAALVGEIALDPTTYLGLGTPTLARTGSRAVLAQATKEGIEKQAREILERAATVGMRNLEDAEKSLVRGLLGRHVDEAGQAAVRRGVARRPLDEAQFRAMEDGLQHGIRLGSTTVLPSHTITRNLMRRATGRAWRGQQLYQVVGERTVEQIKNVDEAVADGRLDEAAALLDDVVYLGYEKGWAGEILNLPGIRNVMGALKPAARTSIMLGPEAAASLRATLRQARAGEEVMESMTQRLYSLKTDGLVDQAIAELEKQGSNSDVLWDQLARRQKGQSVTGMTTAAEKLADELDAVRSTFRANLALAGATDEIIDEVREQAGDILIQAVRYGKTDKVRAVQQEIAATNLSRSEAAGRAIDGEMERLAIEASPTQAMPDGYLEKTINGKRFFIDESVAEDLDNVTSVFSKPRGAEGALKLYDMANTMWGLAATSALPNPAFVNRNILGNIFNMTLAGFNSPVNMARGFSAARRHSAAETMMRQTPGLQYDAALRAVGATERQIETLTTMLGEGLLGTGRVTDVLASEAGRRTMDDTVSRIRAHRLAGAGIRMNEVAETQARIALYLDQVGKGATPRDAGEVVTRFLFDYGDLTTAERKIRRGVRFYTFMRKNTALQVAMLAENPARLARVQKAVDGAEEAILEDSDVEAPPWFPRSGAAGALRGVATAINFETPGDAALDAVGVLEAFGEMMAEYGDPQAQLEDEIAGRPHGASAVADAFTSMLAGFGPSVWDFIQETESGRDSFTGRPLDPKENTRDTALFRLVDTFLPAASRLERYSRQMPGGESTDELTPSMFLLRNVLGVSAYPADEGSDREARDARTIEDAIDNYIRDMESESGEKLPSLPELREDATYRQRDRLREALAYGWTEDEAGELQWDERVYDNTLLSMVPARLRQHWGLPDPDSDVRSISRGARPDTPEEGEEGYADYVTNEASEIRSALETWLGRALDDDEAVVAALLMPGSLTMSEAEDLNIEPIRTTNRFLPSDEQPEQVSPGATLDTFAAAWGLDASTVQGLRPRLSDMERILGEADTAGLSTEELISTLTRASDEGGIGYFNRAESAFLNQVYGTNPTHGIIDLSTTRLPTWTEEDAQKAMEKAWQREMDLRLFARLRGLPAPSDAQIQAYVLNTQMSGAELDLLGEANLDSPESRDDIRTDEMRLRDALSERQAALSGTSASQVFADRYRS